MAKKLTDQLTRGGKGGNGTGIVRSVGNDARLAKWA